MTLRKSFLNDRLRLPLEAAAALLPDLPRNWKTALDATLVLPSGLEHSARVAWTGRHERYCFVSGKGWHALCSALTLREGQAFDIAREQGDVLKLHFTTAGLSDAAAARQEETAVQMHSDDAESDEDTPAADRWATPSLVVDCTIVDEMMHT